MAIINKKKLEQSKLEDLINLIIRLNTKVMFLEREKSKRNMSGKSMSYRAKSAQELIMMFLKRNCEHTLDEVPSIKCYNLFDFRKRLSQFENEK